MPEDVREDWELSGQRGERVSSWKEETAMQKAWSSKRHRVLGKLKLSAEQGCKEAVGDVLRDTKGPGPEELCALCWHGGGNY